MDINGLLKSGFKFSKKYGQNFITDKNFLDSIVAKSGVGKEDVVVEIGAGAGTLTRALSLAAKRVVAYEIDGSLAPALNAVAAQCGNVQVIFRDFMSEPDVSKTLGTDEYKVVANLPYYITTPILFRLIEDAEVPPKSISVMVQREVADRLTAKPGSKDYGALTVAVDYRYEARKIADASRKMFIPEPNVDSAVVLMTRREQQPRSDAKLFSKVVRAAFAMRRKTLVNNLVAAFSLKREQCEALLSECGLEKDVRGEALSREEFDALALALAKRI